MKSPFPYMIGRSGNLYDGYLFSVPAFCKTNIKYGKCKEYYNSIIEADTIHKCPYGFCSYKTEIGDGTIILSCLNISKYSDKNAVARRLHSKDWMPRMEYSVFEKAIKVIKDETNGLEAAQKEFDQKQNHLDQNIQVFNDTLHEVRKINNQLKSSSEQLSKSLKSMNVESTKEIDDIRRNLLANSELLSIRLNTYDMVVNPSLLENALEIDIPVYRYVEKVYKCLYNNRIKKKVNVKLSGLSTSTYRGRNNIELGLFIIIENAIKYSPEGEVVNITFFDDSKVLEVKFQNWGPRVLPQELQKLTDRGYRADIVRRIEEIEGSGLGLYLLKRICESNGIELKIRCGDDIKNINGWIYKPFIVTLSFPL